MIIAVFQTNTIIIGDARIVLKDFPDNSVDMCVTSPPYYGLRDYGIQGQIGQNQTRNEYIADLTDVFSQVQRILKPEGTLWLNIGDTYCGTGDKNNYSDPKYKGRNGQRSALNRKVEGFKSKDLLGIPWAVAFALQKSDWYLRQDIIWSKPNAMPESVKDRCTRSHEYIFLLSKSKNYYFNTEAISEECVHDSAQKKNRRDVWNICVKPFRGAHFAVFPEELAQLCIQAGCPEGGIVLDPFIGSGTTATAAFQLNRRYVGIELNPDFVQLAKERIHH